MEQQHYIDSKSERHPIVGHSDIDDEFGLTKDDVEKLLNDTSVKARLNVSEKVTRHYNHNDLSSQEARVAEEIFRLLSKDIEIMVRQNLAENIKENPSIPRDVIISLANDDPEIAVPILEFSQALSDADLLRIVESAREVERLTAISRRAYVSERVSDALIETNYPQVISELVGNKGSLISDKSFDAILKNHGDNSIITEALVGRRPLIPLVVAERLVSKLSDELVQKLEKDHNISAKDLREKSKKSREDTTIALVSNTSDPAAIGEMVQQMISSDRLSPSIILASLCRGSLTFFETSLAELANIPLSNARKLIHDKGPHGFQALYKKTHLPDSMFDAVRLLLKANKELHGSGELPGSAGYANSLVEKLLYYSGEREVENLSYIIALVRQRGQGA